MKDDNFYMLAKTMFGLEEILAEELRKLGAQNVKPMNRAVSFKGDKGFMYKANLNLRTALRVLKPIAHFQAHNEKELYRKLCEIDWTKFFDLDSTFATHATTHSEVFTHSKYASLVMKDAIADTFRKKFDKRPNVDPETPDVSINLHIAKNTCTVSLDSSGESLHKRGYKKFNSIAPLNEVLAAGVILMSEWDKNSDFLDPMCGTGTILIEAAMIARNIAPNLNRSFFSFEKWKDWDENLFELVEKSVLNKIIEFDHKFYGFDISNSMIKKAEKNIEISQVDVDIEVFTKDFLKSSKDDNDDLFIIINPPYDKRISADVKILYKSIGDTLKNNYQFSNVWLITANLEAIKSIGLKASKRIKLFNANLESRLLNYEIYPGTKKNKK